MNKNQQNYSKSNKYFTRVNPRNISKSDSETSFEARSDVDQGSESDRKNLIYQVVPSELSGSLRIS